MLLLQLSLVIQVHLNSRTVNHSLLYVNTASSHGVRKKISTVTNFYF